MIKFKALRARGQITYPDPGTNKTVVLIEQDGYFVCTDEQAKWLIRFPDLVEVPGIIVPDSNVSVVDSIPESSTIDKKEENIYYKDKNKRK